LAAFAVPAVAFAAVAFAALALAAADFDAVFPAVWRANYFVRSVWS
jgi:hypothetical protein